jgi:hypothetical protein
MQQRSAQLQAQFEEETNPSRHMLHKFFILISIVAALSACNMAVGQFIGIIFQQVGPVQYVLRIYVIALCVLVVFNEMEWTKFMRESKIMRIWITRGLLYSFIGTLGLEENDTSTSRNSQDRGFSFSLHYIKVVAWLMVCCGTLYFFMGVFCLQLVHNRLRNDYQQRLTRAVDVRRTAETYVEQPAGTSSAV